MVNPSREFPVDICTHSALNERKLVKTNQKHALQQASLIGHLEKRGLLDPKYAFVEFGAGKGELSVYVHTAVNASNTSDKADLDIYLVDRKNFRQKFKVSEPEKIDKSEEGHSQQFHRICIDIRDLDLAGVSGLQVTDPLTGETRLRPIVAYSKHLCGAATDLTIRCLERYQLSGGHVAGIAIALCCHHACRYSMYVDHEYLSFGNDDANGLVAGRSGWNDDQRNTFRHIATMSSWAINQPLEPSESQDCTESVHYSRLSYSQRVKAGHAIKRFLDIGRARYVRRQLSMEDAELVYYTLRDTSPENLALLATKIED
ncbi:tRNA:m4X modification enzyme [Coemansia sp. RSA 2703]|nr:tRNA:m4X modification enzyme [Coemansia sp. RSA 2703]KAJ2362620.1 tRNA:m4X modification enzyme [Coemansia sp. RSA 2607]